jgi:hypothetical protein
MGGRTIEEDIDEELAELLTPPLEMDIELEDEPELDLVDPYKGGLSGPIGEPEGAKLITELDETALDVSAGEGVGEP